MINLSEEFILSNWEQDFADHLYFAHTIDGDSIGYDLLTEVFSFNNYRNEIPREKAVSLLRGVFE